ncbi:MAG: tRNA uridine-5-carboxymethylaminomethyl(34) synthesis enzyme MnmG [Legionellales bacterium]|jgi:tRNA uridine 5-carboxymethylaminomethyl modification enzyme|nr:tRNA uridine-5-carboxymethylaminomethyl(34) synthesis enzyme MnmG [Legionellales bacterium]
MKFPDLFDVIVIGGGHAGCEAAYASANMGSKTLLLTQQIDTIGQMSCNPAVGGIGKSQLVTEVDALGGLMGLAADQSGIQYRVLNSSKGPAVQATRAQSDKNIYKKKVRSILESSKNVYMFQQEVADIIVKDNLISGVITKTGISFYGKTVVLTAGTFLGGVIHIGDQRFGAGRAGDPASNVLAEQFRSRGFDVGRLKTGTPARLDGRTIDFTRLDNQPGDTPRPRFSFMTHADNNLKQVPCHITYTNKNTLKIIKDNISKSAIFSGAITSAGPRYCPSIEDKVERFAERENHQIFIEPEGLDVVECYPNGISTSLPFDVQLKFIQTIAGFENAHIMRPGYAIEYDYFDPRGLLPWLETKKIKNLFFAGQINGTTGYEEAAAQGLVAGINACLRSKEQEPWVIRRDQAYIGVMIDDLVNNGTIEPYRMFTSRSEYRLSLRQDNADERLTEIGYKLGVVSADRYSVFQEKQENIKQAEKYYKSKSIPASMVPGETNKAEEGHGAAHSLWSLLKRPEFSYKDISPFAIESYDIQTLKSIEVSAKYEGYISRQKQEIARQKKNLGKKIPHNFDYSIVVGLSNEARQILLRVKPISVDQASRISGITPATISLLLVSLKKHAILESNTW